MHLIFSLLATEFSYRCVCLFESVCVALAPVDCCRSMILCVSWNRERVKWSIDNSQVQTQIVALRQEKDRASGVVFNIPIVNMLNTVGRFFLEQVFKTELRYFENYLGPVVAMYLGALLWIANIKLRSFYWRWSQGCRKFELFHF